MPFIGKNPTAGFSSIVKDSFTPNGLDTTFTLSKQVANANDIAVFVGNVRQQPTTAYTVSGTTLNFGSGNAPASGLDFYVLHIAGTHESSVVPADGTITSAKLGLGAALHVDSSNNRVGIGTTSPTQDLTIVNSGSARMELVSGTSGTSIIDMGDSADKDIGGIRYAQGTDTMQFRAGNDVRMSINASGHVTLPHQPMFIARDIRSSVNMTNEAHVNISRHFTADSSANRGNCFASEGETNAGRFTAPVDGLYHFGWNLFTVNKSANDSTRVGINKNGTTEWSGGDKIGHANQGSCLVELATNDYITLGTQGGSYTAYWYSASFHSRFWGYLVG